jgi:hypothetical protein
MDTQDFDAAASLAKRKENVLFPLKFEIEEAEDVIHE